jgi:hypothetical protein
MAAWPIAPALVSATAGRAGAVGARNGGGFWPVRRKWFDGDAAARSNIVVLGPGGHTQRYIRPLRPFHFTTPMTIRKPALTPGRIAFGMVGAIIVCLLTFLVASQGGNKVIIGIILAGWGAAAVVIGLIGSHRRARQELADERQREAFLRKADAENNSDARPLPPKAQDTAIEADDRQAVRRKGSGGECVR